MSAGPVLAERPVAGTRRTARRRTVAVGAAALTAVLLTAGCAAGRQAQTPNQKPSQDGVNATVGAIAIRSLSVESPSGSAYVSGSAVPLKVVFVNTGQSTDQLTDITSPSATGWGAYSTVAAGQQVQAAASSAVAGLPTPAASGSDATDSAPPARVDSVSVPAGSRVSYGVPDATGSLVLTGTKGQLYPGTTVRMTLTFAKAGAVTVSVPIQLSDTPGQQTIEPSPGESG